MKESREKWNPNLWYLKKKPASLTIEAAFVLPIFLLFFMVFLFFLQIMMVQENLQQAMTEAGKNMAKYTYVYKELFGEEDNSEAIEGSFKGFDGAICVKDLTSAVIDSTLLKFMVKDYLAVEKINRSCVRGGFNNISFLSSVVLDDQDCIDVIAQYQIKIPIKMFAINSFTMLQRVRLRGWTGHVVQAAYSVQREKEDTNSEDPIVYITENGVVYHRSRNCTYLKPIIQAVYGIPTERRNENGAKYYPCEICGKGGTNGAYYITKDGTRYHTDLNCSSLKRTVIEKHLSEVSNLRPCSRCGKSSE